MKRFIVDNKLTVPENEIDNVYVWTKVSRTQEVLMSCEAYYKLIKHLFEQDTKRVVSVLKNKIPSLTEDSYQLSDFITFELNKHKIFNNDTCFAYMNNLKMLNSLACYLAHTKNQFLPIEDTLSGLIINKIDEPDNFTRAMETDFLILKVYGSLPEHKYRSPILDMFLSRRSRPTLSTLVYTLSSGLLIGKDLILKERAEDKKFIDLSPLVPLFEQRRTSNYKVIVSAWLSMMVDTDSLVYSKTKPKDTNRTVKYDYE